MEQVPPRAKEMAQLRLAWWQAEQMEQVPPRAIEMAKVRLA
jgi:hypothetical protein